METVNVKLSEPIVWQGKRREKGEIVEVPLSVYELNTSFMTIVNDDGKPDKAKSQDQEK